MINNKNRLEKDKDGLYIHAPNYQRIRDNMNAHNIHSSQKKLDKIPKWVRRIFNAI